MGKFRQAALAMAAVVAATEQAGADECGPQPAIGAQAGVAVFVSAVGRAPIEIYGSAGGMIGVDAGVRVSCHLRVTIGVDLKQFSRTEKGVDNDEDVRSRLVSTTARVSYIGKRWHAGGWLGVVVDWEHRERGTTGEDRLHGLDLGLAIGRSLEEWGSHALRAKAFLEVGHVSNGLPSAFRQQVSFLGIGIAIAYEWH